MAEAQSKEIRLRLISIDTREHVESLYHQLSVARTVGYKQLLLDLALVSFVRPEGVIALVTAARLWYMWTGSPITLLNIQQQVHCYLERIDLFRTCAQWLMPENELDLNVRWDRGVESPTLLELLPIAGESAQNVHDVESAVVRANHILRRWFAGQDDGVGHITTLISEITSNITHSFDQGFAVIQRYRTGLSAHGRSEVIVAVTDLGIGMQQSVHGKLQATGLRNTKHLHSGSDYILHALNLGVSNHAQLGGVGLSRVKLIVEAWQGSLLIRSFRSSVLFAANHLSIQDDLVEIPGTQVVITVRGGVL